VRISFVELRATVADHLRGPRDSLPMVAFAGRSNVGKSSLLNALFPRRLASVSKTPGKTRTLNYYLVNNRCYFVDLPGYGYARVSKSERSGWGERVTAFLLQEERVRLIVALVDPRVPTSPLDLDLARLAREADRDLTVVMTKVDRIGRQDRHEAARRLTADLGLHHPPMAVSSRTGEGRNEILAAIGQAVGC
jgi:GTP-binding protein